MKKIIYFAGISSCLFTAPIQASSSPASLVKVEDSQTNLEKTSVEEMVEKLFLRLDVRHRDRQDGPGGDVGGDQRLQRHEVVIADFDLVLREHADRIDPDVHRRGAVPTLPAGLEDRTVVPHGRHLEIAGVHVEAETADQSDRGGTDLDVGDRSLGDHQVRGLEKHAILVAGGSHRGGHAHEPDDTESPESGPSGTRISSSDRGMRRDGDRSSADGHGETPRRAWGTGRRVDRYPDGTGTRVPVNDIPEAVRRSGGLEAPGPPGGVPRA